MGQAKFRRQAAAEQARRGWEAAEALRLSGCPVVFGMERERCTAGKEHGGPHSWDVCGNVEPTIDTYPDDVIMCERERGHGGPHRWTTEWNDE